MHFNSDVNFWERRKQYHTVKHTVRGSITATQAGSCSCTMRADALMRSLYSYGCELIGRRCAPMYIGTLRCCCFCLGCATDLQSIWAGQIAVEI